MPPLSTGVFFHARWVNCESMETLSHFNVALLEFFQAVIESDQFGRTHEGEVERVKEHHRVLAFGEFRKLDVFDFIVAQNGVGGEIGSLLTYEYGHDDLLGGGGFG